MSSWTPEARARAAQNKAAALAKRASAKRAAVENLASQSGQPRRSDLAPPPQEELTVLLDELRRNTEPVDAATEHAYHVLPRDLPLSRRREEDAEEIQRSVQYPRKKPKTTIQDYLLKPTHKTDKTPLNKCSKTSRTTPLAPSKSANVIPTTTAPAATCSKAPLSRFPRVIYPSGKAAGGFTKGINTRNSKKTPWCYCGQRMRDVLINHHQSTRYECAGICGAASCGLRLNPSDAARYAAAVAAGKRAKPASPDAIKALY